MAEKVQRVDFTYKRADLRHPDSQVKRMKGDHLVWWYGPIQQNTRPRSIPLVTVYFRKLIDDEPGAFSPAVVPLSSLPHYRIGSIWRDGKCISSTELEEKRLDVDFDEGGWSLTSRVELLRQGNAHVFHDSDYPLKYPQDHGQLLSFKIGNGEKSLLIPCTEYFVRAYARNMEVCRAVATLRWSDVRSVLFDEPRRDEHRWLVRPSRLMRNYDAVFLAHLLYDDYAERAIKSINAQFISKDPSSKIFLKATPWFQGKGQLLCRGRWINGGNTFLCLDLVGSNQPDGQEIEWQRMKFDSREGREGGRIVLPRPLRTAEAEQFIGEHSHAEPDSHSEIIIVKPPPFKLLGTKRKVKKTKHVIKTDRGRLGPKPSEASSHSSGEGSGAGKNVGKLEHGAEAELETHGFLYDIWNAFKSIMAANPDRVSHVNWYTPSRFREQSPPNLILLQPPVEWPSDDKSGRGWVYLDRETGLRRGLLVLRIQVDGQNYFCFEIQPDKPHKPAYSGVLMKSHVATHGEFEDFVEKLCSRVRFVVGRFKNMESFFPAGTKIFKHHQKDAKVLYRSRLVNAFKEIGVELE
ncbi:hypothetical protein [Pseudomonas monteilii]|uniref:TnsE C-terminal domain-containing protein n=1 Tax=Pseudomonas monteilii TaxID=76759 RepID=A0A2N1IRV1_9PSED|nr:hypothetical protein [Pseudomonas monteilii]PKI22288.1 hypothetical protein CXB65_15605 [Pseudomonas monteilii]